MENSPRRERKTDRQTFTLKKDTLARLREWKERSDGSMSAFVERAVAERLDLADRMRAS
jgi:hypothetical protein